MLTSLRSFTLAAVATALTLVACSGSNAAHGGDESSTDSSSAFPLSPTCSALQSKATTELDSEESDAGTCQVDSDCVMSGVDPKGSCAAVCGLLTNTASAASAAAAAVKVCGDYNAAGCPAIEIPCHAVDIVCAAKTCTTYEVQLVAPTAPLTHGVCGSVGLHLDAANGAPPSNDLSVAVESRDATLFADASCTTPLTGGTVTFPAGATDATLALIPLAAGSGEITIGYHGGSGAFTAQ